MAKRQLWELVKDREKSAIRRSEVLKSTLTETHIAALLGEAAALQEKVVQLLTRAQEVEKAEGLTAEKAKLNAVDVLNTILEARRLESAAAGKLQVALDLSRLVQSCARTFAIPKPGFARPARIWSGSRRSYGSPDLPIARAYVVDANPLQKQAEGRSGGPAAHVAL